MCICVRTRLCMHVVILKQLLLGAGLAFVLFRRTHERAKFICVLELYIECDGSARGIQMELCTPASAENSY